MVKKNTSCQDCEETKGSVDSSEIKDSKFIFRSHRVKNSMFLADSVDCDNCAYSFEIKNGTNISHSNQTTDSFNITNSTQILNSVNVSFSTNITNSTLIKQSEDIIGSEDVTLSEDCVGCKACFNCTACRNVTNCSNCFNVTDSINVTNTANSSSIFNSEDISNSKNLTNASNMTNATHCTECKDHANCSGKACFEVIKSPFEIALENKMFFSSKKIIERLYELSNVGDLETYKTNTKLLDLELFRADNYLFDLARYKIIFDEDGTNLDFRIDAEKFVPDNTNLIEKAVRYIIKDKEAFRDDDIDSGIIDSDEGYAIRIADLVNANSDFKCLYDSQRDIKRGVISYKSLINKNDLELEADDDYLFSLKREEDERIICDSGAPDFADCQRKKKEMSKAVKGAGKPKEIESGGEEGEEGE